MLISTEGIVLRVVPYGDLSRMVTIYTQSHGLLSFSLKGRKNAALRYPLSVVHLVSDVRENRTVHYLKELSLVKPFTNTPFDPAKGTVVMFLNELFLKVLQEESSHNELFYFLVKALRELDEQIPLHPSFHLSVMLHLTNYLGFFPQRLPWKTGMIFLPEEGSFVIVPVGHNEANTLHISRLLHEFIAIPFDEYQSFNTDRILRNELLDMLIRYYQMHVAGFASLKSIEVLRMIHT
jgi:DNA repair protein RecO (recombination protein O)